MSAAPVAPATCAWRRALRIIAALLVASSSGNHEAPALNPPSPACSYKVKARQRGRPPPETVALVRRTRRWRAFGSGRRVGPFALETAVERGRRADRKSVVSGKRVLVRVVLGGARISKKKQ